MRIHHLSIWIWPLLTTQVLRSVHGQFYKGTVVSSKDLKGIETMTSSILQSQYLRRGSLILIKDITSFSHLSKKTTSNLWSPSGISQFLVDFQENRTHHTVSDFDEISISIARLRKTTNDVSLLVMSENLEFLSWFGMQSLRRRFLGSSTQLIVITRLAEEFLWGLTIKYWTFSMMNTLFVNVVGASHYMRCNLLVHLPYAPSGPSLTEIGNWSTEKGLSLRDTSIFPNKFINFHGAEVNVSVLDYKPVWYSVKEALPNGTLTKKLTGMDYLLLHTLAEKLNFRITLLPVKSWSEALVRVTERMSFICPAYHAILIDRLKRFDYTVGFTYNRISFSMAKPKITPNWLSLYSPLSNEVWASILVVLLLMPLIIMQLTRPNFVRDNLAAKNFGWIAKTVFGTLLGQSNPSQLPTSNGSRVAMASWLIFAFIITTGYRGNLTASLTLPKYPPRVETIQQLVDTAEKLTMESWGKDYKTSFKTSGIPVLEKLSDLMELGPSLKDGLRQSLERKQGQLDTRHSLEVAISEHFTNRDGTSKFYMGRETVLPGLAGWPIPHDAPFKDLFDWCIQAAIEAGLYEKWTGDMLSLTRQETRRKKREFELVRKSQGITTTDDLEISEESSSSILRALSLAHMQGPLMLYIFGTALGCLVFLFEVVFNRGK